MDFPLTILDTYEDFSRITLKSLVSWPEFAFLDANYPLGTLYLYPIPAATIYDIHILITDVLTQFPDLTTDINLPPEYLAAILLSLGEWLRLYYQMPPDPALTGMARAARETLIEANTEIPLLQMPSEVVGGGGDSGAIYTGGFT